MEIDFDAVEHINYEKSYVAFLDVLGFKNLVFSNKKNDKEKLSQYFGVVNSVVEYLKTIPSKKEIGSIVISDSVILTVPHGQTREENIEKLRHLCVAVGLIQLFLSLKDIWLRGAISSGDTYFNARKNQIVGPGYINAYLLEESLAISPRVILDSKIIKELNFASAIEFIENINMTDEGGLTFDNWGSSVLFNWHDPDGQHTNYIEKDVPLFIDYLAPLVEKEERPLLKVIENIENNIYQSTALYKKFRWVADYLQSLFVKERKNDNLVSGEAIFRLDNL